MNLAAVDFLRKPAQPRIGWGLFAVGMVSLVAALWFARQWDTERTEALRAQQLALAARQAKPKPVRPPEPTLAERRRAQAQSELRRPWLPALRAIESATTDPVYLLSLNIEPATGQVKLDAEAPSFDHAMAYVQMLDEGGALQPAVLVSHVDGLGPRADRPLVRFSVATHWTAR